MYTWDREGRAPPHPKGGGGGPPPKKRAPQGRSKRHQGGPERPRPSTAHGQHTDSTRTPGLISRPWAPPNGSKIHEMDQRSMK